MSIIHVWAMLGVLETPASVKEMAKQQRTLVGKLIPGKQCKECGDFTIIRRDGCDFCTFCGVTGACG